MQENKLERILQVMKDGDEVEVQHQVYRQPALDDPMEVVEEPVADVEMEDIDHAPSIDVQRLMPSESPVQLWSSECPSTPKLARFDENELIAEAVLAYAVSVDDETNLPTTYAYAMNAELRSHEENQTWTLEPRGKIKRTIRSRWLIAKKRDKNGDVVRYKARLVAKGFKQNHGVDFFETYSPVANMNSIRIILAVCAE
ncbi:gag-pol polyprotein [Plasmopara halstedii]|uniref:Gag-pol polyprotein n=1 Tax=Plasmopara halstedii TaxID=4781 RepID=A0A0P1AE85_PLAHL|nr:gag-pol polyprotein [Plasmopara halstedii]CEG38750.1 gag-pol polyprotein [Plasmopara halstedii]|eukprot:XP_024575119.1 gag-pol polyprotein [Plasmopara halstedii]